MGVSMRSTVRKAAKLAVYEEMMIRVKNHHTLPTMRPDIDLENDTVEQPTDSTFHISLDQDAGSRVVSKPPDVGLELYDRSENRSASHSQQRLSNVRVIR